MNFYDSWQYSFILCSDEHDQNTREILQHLQYSVRYPKALPFLINQDVNVLIYNGKHQVGKNTEMSCQVHSLPCKVFVGSSILRFTVVFLQIIFYIHSLLSNLIPTVLYNGFKALTAARRKTCISQHTSTELKQVFQNTTYPLHSIVQYCIFFYFILFRLQPTMGTILTKNPNL